MCKHLQNLDLREPNRLLPSLSLGSIGEPRRSSSSSLSSLSCLPPHPADRVFLPSNQWGHQSQSRLTPVFGDSTPWGTPSLAFQRSVSMVETSSSSGASLGWPGSDFQSDISPTTPDASSSSSAPTSARYKTELCRSFTENGLCKYGGKCQFAHGQEELRDLNRHPKYKTEQCRTFHTIGFCPYGIRCHFVHNSEEEKNHPLSRSSSSSSSSSTSNIPTQPRSSSSSRPFRPPLVRQSFSFSGFPSTPIQPTFTGHTPTVNAPVSRAPSASPPSCADITDLLSHAFLEMNSAFEASPAFQYQPPSAGLAAAAADSRSPFLPSPDSGFSPCGLSPTESPPLRQSPGAAGGPSKPLGARSLSYTSLSDQDQDGSSSASSLSGSESCNGTNDANGRRLAVFSQLSVPDDATGLSL